MAQRRNAGTPATLPEAVIALLVFGFEGVHRGQAGLVEAWKLAARDEDLQEVYRMHQAFVDAEAARAGRAEPWVAQRARELRELGTLTAATSADVSDQQEG